MNRDSQQDEFEAAVQEMLVGEAQVYPATVEATRASIALLPEKEDSRRGWWWLPRIGSRPEVSPILSLVAVTVLVVSIAGIAVLGRFQGGPAGPASPTAAESPSPSATAPAIASPSPTLLPPYLGRLPVLATGAHMSVAGWSPDGSRFALAIDAAVAGEFPTWPFVVFDASGNRVWSVEASAFAWLDSSHYVIQVVESPPQKAYIGQVGSAQVVPLGDCSSLVAGRSGAVALRRSWDGAVSHGPQYEVVESGGASAPRPGYPLAWSRDGGELAVVRDAAPDTEVGGTPVGWLEIVGPDGRSIAAARDVRISLLGPAATFSPDGRYLVFRDDTRFAEVGSQTSVLDIATGRVAAISLGGWFTWFTWAGHDELAIAAVPGEEPGQGPPGLGISAYYFGSSGYMSSGTVGSPGDGLILVGRGSDSWLSAVRHETGAVVSVQIPALRGDPLNGIPDEAWSPDGRTLILIYGENYGDEEAVLVSI